MLTEYLRPLKAKRMLEFADAVNERLDIKLQSLHNVRITNLKQISPPPKPASPSVIIAVDDNDFCAEITPTSSTPTIKGTTIYGGFLRKIWGHFIMGSTARLWPLVEQAQEVDHVLYFAHDTDFDFMSGNYLELFKLLGIEHKIIIVKENAIDIEHLLLPDISYEHDVYFSPQCRDTFNAIINSALQGFTAKRTDRKVFLTRSKLHNVHLNEINIDVLDTFFAQNGYEVVGPEKLTLTEMIRLFAECSHIASISGSTAHNFVFAAHPSQKHFTIIERVGFCARFQISIDKMIGANTAYVDGYYQPKLESSQDRIFIYAMTPEFRKYCADNNLDTAAFDQADSMRHRKRMLQRYCRRYKRYYAHSEGIQPWEVEDGNTILEAIVASREYFSPWLEHFLPLFWSDYLNPRMAARYIKFKLKQ